MEIKVFELIGNYHIKISAIISIVLAILTICVSSWTLHSALQDESSWTFLMGRLDLLMQENTGSTKLFPSSGPGPVSYLETINYLKKERQKLEMQFIENFLEIQQLQVQGLNAPRSGNIDLSETLKLFRNDGIFFWFRIVKVSLALVISTCSIQFLISLWILIKKNDQSDEIEREKCIQRIRKIFLPTLIGTMLINLTSFSIPIHFGISGPIEMRIFLSIVLVHAFILANLIIILFISIKNSTDSEPEPENEENVQESRV